MILMLPNVYVYEKLRVCGRGFSEGKSEANKRATNIGLVKTSNFLYTVLYAGFFYSVVNSALLFSLFIRYITLPKYITNGIPLPSVTANRKLS